jgi:hypothetical protein
MNIPVMSATVAAGMFAAVVLSSSVSPRQSPSRGLSQAERVALFQPAPVAQRAASRRSVRFVIRMTESDGTGTAGSSMSLHELQVDLTDM